MRRWWWSSLELGSPIITQFEDSGTYTVKGTTLRLQSTDGEVYMGTVQDGTLTYTLSDSDPKIVLTYRK